MPPSKENQLVTIADLEVFKVELLNAIKNEIKFSNGIPAKKWLKSSEVRKLIGVSPGKLQTIRETGLLSFTKIGGNIYYDQDDISALFLKNKVQH